MTMGWIVLPVISNSTLLALTLIEPNPTAVSYTHLDVYKRQLFNQVPEVFLQTTWYGQPNLSLPAAVNDILAVVGLLCLVVGAWVLVARRQPKWLTVPPLSAVALLGCIVGGLILSLIHI